MCLGFWQNEPTGGEVGVPWLLAERTHRRRGGYDLGIWQNEPTGGEVAVTWIGRTDPPAAGWLRLGIWQNEPTSGNHLTRCPQNRVQATPQFLGDGKTGGADKGREEFGRSHYENHSGKRA